MYADGYRLSYRTAADNLLLGVSVVADSCNPIEATQLEWEKVAMESGASYFEGNYERAINPEALKHRK